MYLRCFHGYAHAQMGSPSQGVSHSPPPALSAQVFVVGEKTATADITTNFKPTNLPLPDRGQLSERGRRELVRNLEAEQGFAHRAIPVGVITLKANGDLSPGPDKYRHYDL